LKPTIVIGIEPGSAERSTKVGGELARDLGARVVLAHVRQDPPPSNSRTQRERARHRSRRRGTEILDRAHAALPPGVDASERFEQGGVASRLSEIAREEGAALIVVGSRGRGPLASALLGSVSQALSRESPCPVMIIPDSAPLGGARPLAAAPRKRATIVAGVESSEQPSAAVDFAWALAERLGDRLMVVRPHAAGDPPARALEAISAGEDARMIVIGADRANGDHVRRGRSLAARLPLLARCPVVVVGEDVAAPLAVGETSSSGVRRAA
jgi:nucleotide-binding universal stress UspA family protein